MALPDQHICTGSTEPFIVSHCDKYQKSKILAHLISSWHKIKPKLTPFRYKEIVTIGISMKVTICGQNYYN